MTQPHRDTVYGAFTEVVAQWPDRLAVVFEDKRLTYAHLKAEVDRTAAALIASRVEPGERVAMLATSRLEYWINFLATASVGAIWVGLGTRNKLEELRHVVNDAEPSLLISIDSFEGRDYRPDIAVLAKGQSSIRQVIILGDPDPGCLSYDAWLKGADRVDPELTKAAALRIAPMDPALIVYTSGTTGAPKGAVLSHHGLIVGNRAQYKPIESPIQREICSLPINHIACVGDTCVANMVVGGTVVLTERFSPREQLELIQREKINVWGGIPAMVQMVLAEPDLESFDLSSIELTGWGGAAMPRETIARMGAFSRRVGVVYGLTETTTNVTWSEIDADLETLAGTIGKAPAAFPCRIAREDGTVCADEEPGEIQFKSDTNMLGYWRRPEATRDAFTEDGWLRTGDMGVRRADGNIRLVGRRIEAFKSGGFNVYPREVEAALEEHPLVRFSAVVPVPHPLYGEVGYAYVAPADGALTVADLTAFAAGRLANYKQPKTIELLEELPVLPNGKIDKTSLRARAQDSARR